MNFSPLFTFLNTIKALHWTTKSHAHHKVLDDAYSEFSDKIDEFVESCIGANDVKKFPSISITFDIPEDEEELVYRFQLICDELSTSIAKYANTSELESLIDDLNNIANKTIYLLRMH